MMARFSTRSSLLLALLFMVFVLASSRQGDVKGMLTFSVNSLLPPSSCSSPKNKDVDGKSTLPVIPRDGPCNLHSSGEEVRDPAELLKLDRQRVASIQSRFSRARHANNEQSVGPENVRLPSWTGPSIGLGNYAVPVRLGTPAKDLSLIMDTGSDLTWTQCWPCEVSCFEQSHPYFDPSESSSYKDVEYTSKACFDLLSGTNVPPSRDGSKCLYGSKYADQSFSYGHYATEKLTLSPTDEIDDFHFGCGQNNEGHYGVVDGMLGLGRGRISLVGQSATKYGRNSFSYCLPKTSSYTGFLSLGKNEAPSAVFTPMLTLWEASYYGIEMTGIMVGDKQLPISPKIFSRSGTIIDSGTLITTLPKTAYVALRDTFLQHMSNYPLAPPYSICDTCFDFSKHSSATFPFIHFNFGGGVKVTLGQNNIFYAVSREQVCLAFAGSVDDDDVSIYGSKQQLTFEVIYDIPGRRIGFAPHGC